MPKQQPPAIKTDAWAALRDSVKTAPQEWAWNGFLLLALGEAIALQARGMAPWWAFTGWLALLGLAVLAQRFINRGSRWAWAYYPLAMNAGFTFMGPSLAASNPWRADAILQAIDHKIVGENLSLRIEHWGSPFWSDAFSFGYMFFMVLLFGAMAGYLLKAERSGLARFYAGLFTLYGLGFMGYLIVPAAGPYVAMKSQFAQSIAGGWLTQFKAYVVPRGTNHMDVFPSLHIAISSYIWLSLLRDTKRLGWIVAPAVLLLWGSTIYLRYHYAIDVAAGAALGLFCFFAVARGFTPAAQVPGFTGGASLAAPPPSSPAQDGADAQERPAAEGRLMQSPQE